jgi:hypothetical protein
LSRSFRNRIRGLRFKAALWFVPIRDAVWGTAVDGDVGAKRNRPLETSRRFFGFSIFQPLPEADAMR